MAPGKIQAPRREAVIDAISTLMRSVNLQSELNLKFETQFPIPPDRVTLKNCTEDYACALQTIRQALLNELDNKVTFRKRNSQLPISQLPTELLNDILVMSLGPSDRQAARRYFKDIRGLSHVCGLWRQIVKGTPRFWVNIHFGAGPAVEWQICRSGNLPLSLIYHGDKDENVVTSFIERGMRYRVRWESLELQCNHEEFRVIQQHFRDVPMGNLKKIILENARAGSYVLILQFTGNPKLRTLILRGVLLNPLGSTQGFCLLTQLEITGVKLPTPHYLPNLLKSCNGLEDLHLDAISAEWPESQPPLASTEIPLPQVKSITLINYSRDKSAWAPVVRRIHAPSLLQLSVVDIEPEALDVVAHPITDSDPPAILQGLLDRGGFKALKIAARNGRFCLEGSTWSAQTMRYQPDEGTPRLSLSVPGASHSTIRRLSHISLASIPVFLDIDDAYDLSVLKYLPSTVSITLNGKEKGAHRYVNFLSLPDGSTGWICPNLQQLHLRLEIETANRNARTWNALMKKIRLLIKHRQAPSGTDGNVSDSGGMGCKLRVWNGDWEFDVAVGEFVQTQANLGTTASVVVEAIASSSA